MTEENLFMQAMVFEQLNRIFKSQVFFEQKLRYEKEKSEVIKMGNEQLKELLIEESIRSGSINQEYIKMPSGRVKKDYIRKLNKKIEEITTQLKRTEKYNTEICDILGESNNIPENFIENCKDIFCDFANLLLTKCDTNKTYLPAILEENENGNIFLYPKKYFIHK